MVFKRSIYLIPLSIKFLQANNRDQLDYLPLTGKLFIGSNLLNNSEQTPDLIKSI